MAKKEEPEAIDYGTHQGFECDWHKPEWEEPAKAPDKEKDKE